ncbi:MAG: hypothetical protein RL204_616 [Bacteroidota bacterium]
MTKRDFFRIIAKLFGLYIFINYLFSGILTNFSIFSMEEEPFVIVMSIVVVLIWAALFLAIMFKTDSLIDMLGLDKGFEEERIDLGEMKATGLMKIGLIVIGAILVIDNLAPLLYHLVYAFKAEVNDYNVQSQTNSPVSIQIIKVILGAILVLNNDRIVKAVIGNKL